MASAMLAFIDGVGAPEMLLIFVLVLVLFGGQKLPEFARGLGKSIREFKKAAAGVEEEFRRALEEDERKQSQPALTAAPASSTPATPENMPEPSVGPADQYAAPDEYDPSRYDATVEAGPAAATVEPVTVETTPKLADANVAANSAAATAAAIASASAAPTASTPNGAATAPVGSASPAGSNAATPASASATPSTSPEQPKTP